MPRPETATRRTALALADALTARVPCQLTGGRTRPLL
jgi:hypothetical protein